MNDQPESVRKSELEPKNTRDKETKSSTTRREREREREKRKREGGKREPPKGVPLSLSAFALSEGTLPLTHVNSGIRTRAR